MLDTFSTNWDFTLGIKSQAGPSNMDLAPIEIFCEPVTIFEQVGCAPRSPIPVSRSPGQDIILGKLYGRSVVREPSISGRTPADAGSAERRPVPGHWTGALVLPSCR